MILLHVCNNRGAWGAGFSGYITKNYGPKAEESYRAYCKDKSPEELLGHGTIVNCGDITIVNMICQDGYGRDGKRYLQYDDLEECCKAISKKFTTVYAHPNMGCGLAGGEPDVVKGILNKYFKEVLEYKTK